MKAKNSADRDELIKRLEEALKGCRNEKGRSVLESKIKSLKPSKKQKDDYQRPLREELRQKSLNKPLDFFSTRAARRVDPNRRDF